MNDQQTITNAISLILVIVTGLYVFLTWRIAQSNSRSLTQMNEQFQETIRPFVIPIIKIRNSVFLSIEIENMGKSPATNLELSLDKDFFQFAEDSQDRNIRRFEAFNQVIQIFAPGEKLRFDLAQGFNIDVVKDGRNLTPKHFSISATYESNGRKYADTFHIDVGPYMHTHTRKTASENLEIIAKHLEKIASKQ